LEEKRSWLKGITITDEITKIKRSQWMRSLTRPARRGKKPANKTRTSSFPTTNFGSTQKIKSPSKGGNNPGKTPGNRVQDKLLPALGRQEGDGY